MVGLCIAEPYYRLGLCRVERFEDMRRLREFKARLGARVTSWVAGEEEPKRRDLELFY